MGQELRAVLDRLDSTACVLTTVHQGRRAACLATYVIAAGLDVHRLLVLTSHENLTNELVEASGVVAVHPVPQDRLDWVARFGHASSREVDKLDGLDWREGETGCAILADALGYVEGRVIGTLDCGDHTARLVEPVAAGLFDPDEAPLTWFAIVEHDSAEARVDAPPTG